MKSALNLLFLMFMAAVVLSTQQLPLKRNYQISGFTSVVVSGPLAVTIQYGKVSQVTAQVNSQWLLARLSVKKSGKTLIVKLNGAINLSSPNDMPMIQIIIDKLTGVQALNTATVQLHGSAPKVPKFTAVSSGVSTLSLESVKADTFYLTAKDVSTLNVGGTGKQVVIDASDMGTIDGSGLTCEQSYISADKMSNVKLTVDNNAEVIANGMSTVNIFGDAQVSQTADFMSTVTCDNC